MKTMKSKNKFLQIRVSVQEHEAWSQLAIQSKTSISDYVRSKLKDSIPVTYQVPIQGQILTLTKPELKELLSNISTILIQ